MNRRTFTKKTVLACCGALAGSTILESCTTTKSLFLDANENSVIVPIEKLSGQTSAIINSTLFTTPVYIFKEGNTWHALLMSCTHVQCEVKLAKDTFICPCHGSQFALDGDVLTGPAQQPLEKVSIEEKDNQFILTK